jgi:hypothetical protein
LAEGRRRRPCANSYAVVNAFSIVNRSVRSRVEDAEGSTRWQSPARILQSSGLSTIQHDGDVLNCGRRWTGIDDLYLTSLGSKSERVKNEPIGVRRRANGENCQEADGNDKAFATHERSSCERWGEVFHPESERHGDRGHPSPLLGEFLNKSLEIESDGQIEGRACPIGYLEMVALETYGGTDKWRASVQSHHRRLRKKK